MNNKEFDKLQDIGKIANYRSGMNAITSVYTSGIFKRYIKNNKSRILELGPAEGIMTDLLANDYCDYTIIEAVTEFCEKIQKRHQHIKVNNCLFEEYDTNEKYDVIILSHVLEHVSNPIEILKKVKLWLKEDGVVLAAVPNSNSIHRQVAVLMGILRTQDELGETDKLIGHRRVYNLEKLKKDFEIAGINVINFGGYLIKALTNKHMEETFNEEMIDAFMELGEKYPEIAAEIYVVGKGI